MDGVQGLTTWSGALRPPGEQQCFTLAVVMEIQSVVHPTLRHQSTRWVFLLQCCATQ